MGDIEKVKKDTLSILKSCLASSKGNITVEELLRDYKQLTGTLIPFRQFGFTTFIQYLESIPQDVGLSYKGGKTFVTVPESEETAHIQKLVQRQKTDIKKFKPTRKPYRPSKWISSRCDSFQRRPPLSSNPRMSSNYFPPQRNFSNQGPFQNFSNDGPFQNFSNDGPFHNFSNQGASQNFSIQRTGQNFSNQRINNNIFSNQVKNQISSYIRNNNYKQNNEISKMNVPYRQPATNENYSNNVPYRTPVTNQNSNYNVPRPTNKPIKVQSCRQKLAAETQKRGIEIKYTTFQSGKKNKYWVSTLDVLGTKFSSYPIESLTNERAEEIVAEKALEQLQDLIDKNCNGVNVTEDFKLVTDRIRSLLKGIDAPGIWLSNVRLKYNEKYKETLPLDWITKATNDESILDISFNHPKPEMWILSLKKNPPKPLPPAEVNSNTNVEKSEPYHINVEKSEPYLINVEKSEPEPFKLPEDTYWNVHVTYIKDCCEVWFRINENEYTEAFEEMALEMDLYYMEKKNQISIPSPEVGAYYTCNLDSEYHRIQLQSIEGEEASVFFIDIGDVEKVPLTNLLLPNAKFFDLSPQAIRASLVDLEIGLMNENIHELLNSLVLGKDLSAEVISKDDPISVVLFDTSGSEDININEEIIKQLLDSFPEPSLPSKGAVCKVYITHVSQEGDIFVRIQNSMSKTFQTLLQSARNNDQITSFVDNTNFKFKKYYLAKFSTDGEWHRATPKNNQKNNLGKVLLEAIDEGYSELVECSNIIPLEEVSELLCKFPAQAISCRLHCVPSTENSFWTPKTTERLNEIIQFDNTSLLKIMEHDRNRVPQVQLFQRVQPQNLLVSINATLDMEDHLFSEIETISSNSNEESSMVEELSKLELEDNGKMELTKPVLPALNYYFEVFVTYAATPFNFAVQAYKNMSKIQLLMGEMYDYYTTNKIPKVTIKVGNYYALKHTDDQWYRVYVERIVGEQISGLFTDYGDCFYSTRENFQPLVLSFSHFPQQSFRAKLEGISPKNGDWTPEDCVRFRKLVENKAFVALVTRIIPPEDTLSKLPHTLELSLIDTKDDNVDVYIAEILIAEGRAVKR